MRADWQEYEDAIARHYQAIPNCKVIKDAKVASLNGRLRQIDVLLEITAPADFKFKVAVEAKLHGKKLDSDTFDAIRAKFVSIGVDLGIIYCPLGLESGPELDLQKYTNPRIELKQMSLEDVLRSNWGDDFLIAIEGLSKAKNERAPGQSLQDEVVASIERIPLYARYFFHNLDNDAWLPIFIRRGVFERSLDLKNSIPPLLSSEYVVKGVKTHPSEFLQFSSYVKSSFHWLESDLIAAALELPAEERTKFVDLASEWEYQALVEPDRVKDLITDQVKQGRIDSALRLLSRITRLVGEKRTLGELGDYFRSQSSIQEYDFKELTWKFLPDLARLAPEQISVYARDRLLESMAIDRPDRPNELPTYAVANVAEDGQFGPLTLLGVLVVTYRDVLRTVGESAPEVLFAHIQPQFVSEFNTGTLRVALYAATEHFDIATRLLPTILATDEIWHNLDLLPELESFVEKNWPRWSQLDREAIVSRVISLHAFDYGKHVSDVDVERYRRDHVANWLLIIQPLGLPENIESRAMALLHEYTSESGKSKPYRHEGIRVHTVNAVPTEARNFENMPASEILAYCRSFVPIFDFFNDDKTPHGVATALTPEVAKRPQEFLEAEDLVDLPYPSYHSAVVRGLDDALKNKVPFEIERAIAIMRRICDYHSYKEPEGRNRDTWDFGKHEWVRNDIAGFLEEAAQSHEEILETQDALFNLWQQMWPSANRKSGVDGEGDALTAAINSEGGQLAMALCRLALRAHYAAQDGGDGVSTLDAWFSQLKSIIEQELLASQDLVVRAPLGFFYTSFFIADETWTKDRTDMFFDAADDDLWEAAWSCHFWMTQRYVQVFSHLKSNYLRALSRLPSSRSRSSGWAERLGDDVAIFWMEGVLTEGDQLFVDFWQKAPSFVQRSATLWINSKLKRETWASVWPLAKRWWELAVSRRSDSGDDEEDDTLGIFLYWLERAPETLSLAEISNLLAPSILGERHFLGERVYDFIADRARSEPEEAARAVDVISRNSMVRSTRSDDARLKQLMITCFQSGSPTAQDTIRGAHRRMLESGLFSFEGLLPKE